MQADYQLSLQDYLAIARRWALAIALTFCAVLAISVVVAFMLPRVYQATGTLLVEGSQIANEVGRSPSSVTAEQRVQVLGQRIMTRETLLRIAAEHQVFEPVEGVVLKDADVAEAMRKSIQVYVQTGNMPSWERPTTNVAFNVSFEHGKPEKALEVTNALIRLFLESSARDKLDQAARANEFLGQEADRVKAQLEDLEQRIEAYKRARGSVSEEGQALVAAGIQTLEGDLRAAERDHRLALDELQTLQVDLAAARAGVLMPGTVSAPSPSVAEQEMERARTELARLRGTYSDDHPDVRSQQRKVETLERALQADKAVSSPAREAAAAQARLTVARLEAQIGATRARADLLADQQRSLRNSINQQRAQLTRAPQVERDLAALQRDHDTARAKYEDLRSKQMSAQIAQNMEGGQQGERITLLEPPLLPEYPIKPSRRKLVALGFFLALAAAAGVAVLLEVMFARVRGRNALTAITGQRLMVVIPYIATEAEQRSNQLQHRRFVGLLIGLGLIGLVMVHFLISPLHTLLISLFARLG